MITAIIVDDEKSGRETLAFILERHFSAKINVLGMGSNLNEGVELIKKYSPNVVFLDMEMPNELGLNILKKVDIIDFEIIVTTAHKNYGIDAIKAGVLDYLLKPIDIDELAFTISKIEAKIAINTEHVVIKKMINRITTLNPNKQKIPLLISNNKTIFVDVNTIVRCEADGNYTKIYFTNGKSELITKLIKDTEDLLNDFNFFRVHKSHLINMDHVKAFVKSEDDITMVDDSTVPLSRNIKVEFLNKMNI